MKVALTRESKVCVTLLRDDTRTGHKAGRKYFPLGVYWNGKNVVLVGDRKEGHAGRLAIPADIVKVELES